MTRRRDSLSDRQQEILDYICEYANDHGGNSPSVVEISEYLDRAYSSVYGHVQRLIVKGALIYRDGKWVVAGAEWYAPVR